MYVYIYYRTPDICWDTFGILLTSLHNFTIKIQNADHVSGFIVWSHQLRSFFGSIGIDTPGWQCRQDQD